MGIRGLPSRLREEVRIFMGREGNPSEVEETKSRSSQQTVQATEESGIRSVMGERRGRGPESHAPRGIGQTLQGSFERLYRSQNLQASMRLNMRLKALAEIYTLHSFAQTLHSQCFVKMFPFFLLLPNFY